MRTVVKIALAIIITSCTSKPKNLSAPHDSSRPVDPTYTAVEISSKIEPEILDQHLSRFYAIDQEFHFSAIPLTGVLLDTIGFIKTSKIDYNKFEYKKVSASYRAYLFNKVSCFFVFAKGPGDVSQLRNYEITIGNIGQNENKAIIKNEIEHQSAVTTLNEIFPKSYSTYHPRSIDINALYTQELVCGNKIDFQKPFFIKLKSKDNSVELFWN